MRWTARKTLTPIGLDLDGGCLRAIQLSGDEGRLRVEAAASIPRREPSAPLAEDEMQRFRGVLDRRRIPGGCRGRRNDGIGLLPFQLVAQLPNMLL